MCVRVCDVRFSACYCTGIIFYVLHLVAASTSREFSKLALK